jgi:hypothetical protein
MTNRTNEVCAQPETDRGNVRHTLTLVEQPPLEKRCEQNIQETNGIGIGPTQGHLPGRSRQGQRPGQQGQTTAKRIIQKLAMITA